MFLILERWRWGISLPPVFLGKFYMEIVILVIGCINCLMFFGIVYAVLQIFMYLAPFEEEDGDDSFD